MALDRRGAKVRTVPSMCSANREADLKECPMCKEEVLAVQGVSRRARVRALGAPIFAALLVMTVSGCSVAAVGAPRKSGEAVGSATSASPTASATDGSASALTSLTFAEGARIDPLAAVGWSFSTDPGNGAWTLKKDPELGGSSYYSADGLCRAHYSQENFATMSTDDLVATRAYLAMISDTPADQIAEYDDNGQFAFTAGLDGKHAPGAVAARWVMMGDPDGYKYVLTARVFTKVDHTKSGMNNAYLRAISCDGKDDPVVLAETLDDLAFLSVVQP
jgi:hypothetical protein